MIDYGTQGLLVGSVAGSVVGVLQSMTNNAPLMNSVIRNGVNAGIFGGLCFTAYAAFKFCM